MPNRISGRGTQPTSPHRADAPALREGASGPRVALLQRGLAEAGFDPGTSAGTFGASTTAALKSFQSAKGLTADGVAGPKTWEKLTPAAFADTAPPNRGWAPKPPGTRPAPGVASKQVVTLTFDDGPHPVNTPKVLDILKQFGVKGTFFVTGQGAEKNPELIRRIVAEGHALGNHTWDHANLSKLTKDQITSQLDRTQAAIDKALGTHYELTMIRPPYGATNANMKPAAGNKDVVLWNVDSNDWRYKNDDTKIIENIFEGSNSVRVRGGTILMHDIHPQTVRVLDDVIARLQREGYDIQRTDDVLASKRGVN
ncbi:MAG: polysaccharide deacetylase family protein [Myxococcaceae bacterium]